MEEGEDKKSLYVRATDYVAGKLGRVRQEKPAIGESLQRRLPAWPDYDKLVAFMYVEFQKAADAVEEAAAKAQPNLAFLAGRQAELRERLVWMTRYARPEKSGTSASRPEES